MNNQDQSIYQSGQKVLMDGWYEAIAAKVPTASQFTTGQTFPNHDGRAVCWRSLQSKPSADNGGSQAPNYYESDIRYGGMYA